jgi:hypothetical protein
MYFHQGLIFMDKLVIRGGEPLLGTVRVSGAKNAALPCMAAALLTDEPVILENIPQVRDIQTTRNLLAAMGADVELGYGRAQHRTTLHCKNLTTPEASYELVKTMRSSTLRPRPRLAPRRLRHRKPSHRHAHQGTRAARRKDHTRPRLRRSQRQSAQRHRNSLR